MRPLRAQAPRGVSRLVLQFALSGVAALVVLGVAGAFVLRAIGTRESVRDARNLTEVIARGVIGPRLDEGVLRRDPASLARLDRTVRTKVLGRSVVRVKLWRADGTILYSDERRLIGSRYPLEGDELTALRTGAVAANVSDLSRPENRFEPAGRKLLEVYAPVSTPGGEQVLVEAYIRFSSITARGRSVWLTFAPVFAAGLVLLWLVQLPLAWSLARRLQAGQEEREQLFLQATSASETERLRIASDLHDGAVQDLAGISYGLAASADRAASLGEDALAAELREASVETRRSLRQLRSLLVELSPASLETAGLAPALADVLAEASTRGLATRLEVDEPDLPADAQRLVYRAAQEGVRNVLRHADAASVSVSVDRVPGGAVLLVEDDGRGAPPDALERSPHDGLGLRLLSERVADLGGVLQLERRAEGGTRLRVEVVPR